MHSDTCEKCGKEKSGLLRVSMGKFIGHACPDCCAGMAAVTLQKGWTYDELAAASRPEGKIYRLWSPLGFLTGIAATSPERALVLIDALLLTKAKTEKKMAKAPPLAEAKQRKKPKPKQ